MRKAGRDALQDPLLDAMFQAYFIDGRDIGNSNVLIEIGESVGLSGVADYLAGSEDSEEVRAEDSLARRQGINGVPCFIFNYRFLLSGAQEPESFFQLFDLAREEEAGALRESAG
jgi:predicted DsbA family dithiol-disulfide isomerase